MFKEAKDVLLIVNIARGYSPSSDTLIRSTIQDLAPDKNTKHSLASSSTLSQGPHCSICVFTVSLPSTVTSYGLIIYMLVCPWWLNYGDSVCKVYSESSWKWIHTILCPPQNHKSPQTSSLDYNNSHIPASTHHGRIRQPHSPRLCRRRHARSTQQHPSRPN